MLANQAVQGGRPVPAGGGGECRINARMYARVAGALYLVIIVLGVCGEAVIRASLVVFADPAETARRILASESLWRLGVAAQLVLLVCAIGMTFTWYILLRPVNKPLTILATMFGLVSLAIESVGLLHLQAVLTPLTNAASLKGMSAAQAHTQAYLSVLAHGNAFGVALVFFGVQCLIVGYLIRKSRFFPAAIGAAMQLVGLCYVVNSFARILYPALANLLFPWILLPCLVGESLFCLWLLIKGVDDAAWQSAHRRTLH